MSDGVISRLGDDLEVAADGVDIPAEYSDDEIQQRFDNLDESLNQVSDVSEESGEDQ